MSSFELPSGSVGIPGLGMTSREALRPKMHRASMRNPMETTTTRLKGLRRMRDWMRRMTSSALVRLHFEGRTLRSLGSRAPHEVKRVGLVRSKVKPSVLTAIQPPLDERRYMYADRTWNRYVGVGKGDVALGDLAMRRSLLCFSVVEIEFLEVTSIFHATDPSLVRPLGTTMIDRGEDMTTSKDFSPPYNWCDSRCNCCPLDDCSVRMDMDRSAWAHEMRGEDPDDPEVGCRDMENNLGRAMGMLTEIATEEGINLDEPLEPPRIVSLKGQRLSKAGHLCFTETVNALRTPAMQGAKAETMSAASEVLRLTSLLKMKTARFTSYDVCPSDDVWEFDGIPNLLLLEATMRAVSEPLEVLHAALPAAHWRRVRDAVLTLGGWVEELLSGQTEARRALEALVKERRAPSPFCWI